MQGMMGDWSNYLQYNGNVYGQVSSCYCKKSYFRVLNSFNSELDVQINDILMAENLKNGEFTRYARLEPGTYDIRINESGKPNNLVFQSLIEIDRNLTYTGVIAKDDKDKTDICVLVIPEAKEHAITGRMSAIRFTNLTANTPELELVTSDGTILFSNIKYSDVSNNVAVPSGRYTLKLKEKNSDNVIKSMNFDFAPRMHYTLFLIGNNGDYPDVQIVIPEDGVNYLELC